MHTLRATTCIVSVTLIGFIEAYERFSDDSFNDDSIVSTAKESFTQNSFGIGERDRWNPEYEAFRHSVGRLKAVYKALNDFCAAEEIEINHVLHFNGLAKVWIADAKRYLDLPMPIDETACKLTSAYFSAYLAWTDGRARTYRKRAPVSRSNGRRLTCAERLRDRHKCRPPCIGSLRASGLF